MSLGRGITEYGAILAFVALLIAAVISVNGQLAAGLKTAFSGVVSQLNSLASGS